MNYLLIELNVNKYNANSGFYTVGLPAITAFAGFFHNLQRKMNTILDKYDLDKNIVYIQDFAILAKDIQLREGHPKYVKALKSSEKYEIPASTIDEKIADGKFAFILRYEDYLNNNQYAKLAKENLAIKNFPTLLEYVMLNTKLAGGSFKIQNKDFQTHCFTTSNDFEKINKRLTENYFYIVDEIDKLENLSFNDFTEMIARSKLKKHKNNEQESNANEIEKKQTAKIEYKPFYIPIVPGFKALETPKEKMNSTLRNNKYKHAFVEPVLSLARYQSVNSVLSMYRKNESTEETDLSSALPKIFWQYHQENDFYLVKAKTK